MIGPSTPGPGNYRRPPDSCYIKNAARPSPAFCVQSERIYPRKPSSHQRSPTILSRKQDADYDSDADSSASSENSDSLSHNATFIASKKKAARKKAPLQSDPVQSDVLFASTMLTGGGLGAGKFETARVKSPEPDPNLGPGCYPGVADARLRLMPRRAKNVHFSTAQLGAVTRLKPTLSEPDLGPFSRTGKSLYPSLSLIHI